MQPVPTFIVPELLRPTLAVIANVPAVAEACKVPNVANCKFEIGAVTLVPVWMVTFPEEVEVTVLCVLAPLVVESIFAEPVSDVGVCEEFTFHRSRLRKHMP